MESVLWDVLGPHACNNEKKKYVYTYDKAKQDQIDQDRQLVEGFGSTSSSNSILKTSILVGLTCLRWKTIMSHLHILAGVTSSHLNTLDECNNSKRHEAAEYSEERHHELVTRRVALHWSPYHCLLLGIDVGRRRAGGSSVLERVVLFSTNIGHVLRWLCMVCACVWHTARVRINVIAQLRISVPLNTCGGRCEPSSSLPWPPSSDSKCCRSSAVQRDKHWHSVWVCASRTQQARLFIEHGVKTTALAHQYKDR